MNICSDKNATSSQIVRHIENIDTPMLDVRQLMVDIAKQYQKMDKLGMALGLFDKGASFIDNVSWCSVVGKMDHHKKNLGQSGKKQLTQLVEYLDDLVNTFNDSVISKIQQVRDKWMTQVLLVDIFALIAFATIIAASVYGMDVTLNPDIMLEYIKQRPAFYSFVSITLLVFLLSFHFTIRRIVLQKLLDKLDDKLPVGMSLSKALSKNTGISHSIFRPEPVGWNMYQQKRLELISNKLQLLRDKLSVVLENHSEEKEKIETAVNA